MSVNTINPVAEEDNVLPEWWETTDNSCPGCEKERQGEGSIFSEHVSDPNGCLYVNPCLGCWLELAMDNESHLRRDHYPGGCRVE